LIWGVCEGKTGSGKARSREAARTKKKHLLRPAQKKRVAEKKGGTNKERAARLQRC